MTIRHDTPTPDESGLCGWQWCCGICQSAGEKGDWKVGMTSLDIAWLAGLLEGEGCFSTNRGRQIIIQLCMTDKDVMERAASILKQPVYVNSRKLPSGKALYRLAVHGPHAIGWMMSLYLLMSTRRREKIRECIQLWQALPGGTDFKKYERRYMNGGYLHGRQHTT